MLASAKGTTKVGSTATVVRNSVLIISHITFRDCRVHLFSDNLSRNSCITTGNTVGRYRHLAKGSTKSSIKLQL